MSKSNDVDRPPVHAVVHPPGTETAKEALEALYRIQSFLGRQMMQTTIGNDVRTVEEFLLRHPTFKKAQEHAARVATFQAEREMQEVVTAKAIKDRSRWPDVPKERKPITEWFPQLPSVSGIYIAYRGRTGRCVYVGQSVNLAQRVSFPGEKRCDGQLWRSDWLSIVEIPVAEIFYAEAYYIGLLKPSRNLPQKFRLPVG